MQRFSMASPGTEEFVWGQDTRRPYPQKFGRGPNMASAFPALKCRGAANIQRRMVWDAHRQIAIHFQMVPSIYHRRNVHFLSLPGVYRSSCRTVDNINFHFLFGAFQLFPTQPTQKFSQKNRSEQRQSGAVLRWGRGDWPPPIPEPCSPKSLVTVAVCSSKTSKQLYRGRFLEGWSGWFGSFGMSFEGDD